MNALNILLSLFIVVFLGFLAFQVFKLLEKIKASSSGFKAKDVYVVKHDDKSAEANNPAAFVLKKQQQMMEDLKTLRRDDRRSDSDQGLREMRKYQRVEFESFVEFIKEGKLFKETSKNLSYTGMFIKSKSPEKYKVDDSILITFQYPKGHPQKREGKIIRVEKKGIGVRFLNV